MEREFFLRQLADLTGVSICRYNGMTKENQNFGERDGIRKLNSEQSGILERNLLLQDVEYPLIRMYQADKKLLFVQIRDPGEERTWYLVGPVAAELEKKESLQYIREEHASLELVGFPVCFCSPARLTSGVILLYSFLTGKEMGAEEFWRRNEESFFDRQKVWEQMEMDIFDRQEQYGPHNPYEQEMRELESIRTGDVEALNFSIAETYEGELGTLAKEPLRHHKNIAVGNITLASRIAIRGGVNKEQSFSMADSFIQQIEKLNSVPEVIALKREAQRAFAMAVHFEQNSDRQPDSENPLIAGVKDYIFSHLHDSIQIADIAKHLNVNADYLSHLFRTHENMTMKQYIQKEKVRRGRNLLRYSEASIHEIAFYLGFSSQSHFSNVFQKITGETPSSYQKKFLDRRHWKMWDIK